MILNAHELSVVQSIKARLKNGARCRADHREIAPGDVFFAWPGTKRDGRDLLPAACAQGAESAVVEAVEYASPPVGMTVMAVERLQHKAGTIMSQVLGEPSRAMTGVAVTGTNGKTSVTRWVAQALEQLKLPCAVIGTLGAGRMGVDGTSTGLTTPDAIGLQYLLRTFADQGVKAFAIEASSIGLEQGRLNGTELSVVAFTNLSRDHLDYHHTMHAYGQAKLLLAQWVGASHAVVNVDDPFAADFISTAQAAGKTICRVSAADHPDAEVRVAQVSYTSGGMQGTLIIGSDRCEVRAPVVGQFNIENLAVVAGILHALGYEAADIVRGLGGVSPPPGRMQVLVHPDAPMVVIDYAHTPDALDKVLTALQSVAQSRQGCLHVVFGCGGDRDPGKRPQMGAIASRRADRVVITSDNPRSENPQAIIDQIMAGVHAADTARVATHLDRAQAIANSIAEAHINDVVVLAGKGHETTQTTGAVVIPFSDAEHAQQAMALRQQERL